MGDTVLKIESSDASPKEAFAEVAFWDEFIRTHKKCGKCGSENISLFFRDPKGDKYYGAHCNDCGAEKNIGQHKNAPTFFCKPDAEWSIWDRSSDYSGGNQGNQNPNQGGYSAPQAQQQYAQPQYAQPQAAPQNTQQTAPQYAPPQYAPPPTSGNVVGNPYK